MAALPDAQEQSPPPALPVISAPPGQAAAEPPRKPGSSVAVAKSQPILFDLPSLKRFPVSQREAHVLGTYREDGSLVPRFSPSLKHRPGIIVAPPRDASGGAPSMPSAQAAAAAGGMAPGQRDAAAAAEALARLDAAVAALREYAAGTPQRPVAAGKDKIVVVVHAGRHLPKASSRAGLGLARAGPTLDEHRDFFIALLLSRT
jgi:hypothetical protein